MTNKARDTQLMLLVVLDFRSRGSLIDNILSHETVDPYLKIHFQCFKLILSEQDFHVLLINKHFLRYNQIG